LFVASREDLDDDRFQADLLWLFFREALVHAITPGLRERAQRDFFERRVTHQASSHGDFRIVGQMSKPAAQPPNQIIEYSNFASVVTGEGDWMLAGFPLPDGGFWQYREPDAVVIVQDGFLRVAAVPYTRGHDTIQFLDNAKHMYFSTRTFECPPEGTITFSIDLAATIIKGAPGDLYDGFVSFNVLDFSTGAALDFFVGNETIATVYGKLPFPGVPIVDPARGPRH
jgi:hypothetical protein